MAAQDLLVEAYTMAGRTSDAIVLLKRQLDAREDPSVQLKLGQLLREKGEPAAREVLERAHAARPDSLAAVAQLAVLDSEEGRSPLALQRVDAFLASHPKSAEAYLLKASLMQAAKEPRAAEQLAKQAVELQPDLPAAHGLLADILLADGRPDEAIASLESYLEVAPDNVGALMRLGCLLTDVGRRDEAAAAFTRLTAIAPHSAAAHNNLACLLAELPEKLTAAATHARKARSLDDRNPAILDTLGWIEWRLRNFPEALSLLRVSASGLPDAPSVHYHLGLSHYMMNRQPEAASALEHALAINAPFPEKDDALRRLSLLKDLQSSDQADLESEAEKRPDDVVVLLELARRRAASDKPAEAIASYDKALSVNPALEAAHLEKARIYLAAPDQPGKAAEAAAAARKVSPDSPHAAAVLAKASFRLGQHEKAYALLSEAVRHLPDDAGASLDLAWAAYSKGRVDEARSLMTRFAGHPEHAVMAGEFLALTAPRAADQAEAAAIADKRLSENERDVPALMVRAAMSAKAGRSPDEDYHRVLQIFPKFDPARLALAKSLLLQPGKLEEAEKLVYEAREQLRDDPEVVSLLGLISSEAGKHDRAISLLSEAATRRPLSGTELHALGTSQAAKGQREARHTLAKALDAGLSPEEVLEVRDALKALDQPAATD
jgi:tetratricopeptide (TPR) repeat protein